MNTMPFFMTNEDWYYFDDNEIMYKMKSDAPIEAVQSYNEYYNNLDNVKLDNEELDKMFEQEEFVNDENKALELMGLK